MLAVQAVRPGGPEVLEVIDLPVPEARTAIEGVGLVMLISPDTVEDPERIPGTREQATNTAKVLIAQL